MNQETQKNLRKTKSELMLKRISSIPNLLIQSTANAISSTGKTNGNGTISRKASVISTEPAKTLGRKGSMGMAQLGIAARPELRRQYSSTSVRIKAASVKPSDFEKIRLLGKGDVGKVYLVRRKDTGRMYALKVLSKKEMVKRNKIKRALAEQVC